MKKRLIEAMVLSKNNKGHEIDGEMYGVGEISGTKVSGAVKRAALDLKNELTKITK